MAMSKFRAKSPRGGRPTVEDAVSLRVRDLRRPGWGWVSPDLIAADGTVIRCRIDVAGDTAAWLHLEHWRPGAAWAASSYTVALIPRPQRFGGVRWLFRDPDGFGLCSTLFLPAGASSFASRQAHGLAHRSQRQRAPARAADRAQRIRQDLGGSGDLDAPFPAKPKGMWSATYDRLRAASAEIGA